MSKTSNHSNQINTTDKLATTLSIIGILGSLINCNIFGSLSLAALIFYLVPICILTIYTAYINIRHKGERNIKNQIPFVLWGVLSLYFLFKTIIQHQPLSLRHFIIIGSTLLLWSFSIQISLKRIAVHQIAIVIIVLACIEAFVCIFQYANLLPALNKFINVTGTWNNPNVTGMFITMSCPLLFLIKGRLNRVFKFSFLFIFILFLISLALLKCRTAWIGIILICTYFLSINWNCIEKLKRASFQAKFFSVALITLLVTTLSYFTYNLKKESSEGRQLIWKLGLGMALSNPLTGIGLGKFEHDYNLKQAEYFGKQNGSQNEIRNARHINMAYNEWLQIWIEGGLPALFIILILVYVLLFNKPKYFSNKGQPIISEYLDVYHSAYAGCMIFIIMSTINFGLEALPAFYLFMLFNAILTTSSELTIK